MPSLRKAAYRYCLALNLPVARELAFMRKAQWLPRDRVMAIQQERLERLLVYAQQHVPYYRALFARVGLVQRGRVVLERFPELPVLDKSAIRTHWQALTSDVAHSLHAARNRTGGSTGEPLVFLQDRNGVHVAGGAVLRLFYEWHGVYPGDREIKLWGSDRDLFGYPQMSLVPIREWFSGVKVLNAFRMGRERMKDYIEAINTYRPKLVRGYSSSLFELARFAEESGLRVRPPRLVISSAGTLYPILRQKMASVYGCPVYNHYGSREMHNMAMECPTAHGLHISACTHLIEVLDEHGRACPPGVEGDLVLTSFCNLAMPFIRYRIGDRGALSEDSCPCGRGLPLLASLSGRSVECFRTPQGAIIPGEYFIHLLGVHVGDTPIAKFQAVQEGYDHVRLAVVLQAGRRLEPCMRRDIEDKIRLVMGGGCRVSFECVDDIPPTPEGKHLYTLSKVCGLPLVNAGMQ